MKKTWLLVVFVFVAIITVAAQPGKGGANPPSGAAPIVLDHIIDPNAVVFSKTFSEWDAVWQQWAYSIPVSNHPLFDKGSCSVGQSGPVWFLGGKFCGNDEPGCSVTDVQRSCTVPKGKFLYFPVWNGEDSALEEDIAEHPGDPYYQQIGYLRAYEDPWGTGVPDVAYASIDGVSVPHLENYKVQSVAFGFTMPDDNYLAAVYPPPNNNFKAGQYFPAVDMGEYLMLKPLQPGRHVIKFGAHFPSGDWGFNVTYFLTVQ
jgi:hypothetical protein